MPRKRLEHLQESFKSGLLSTDFTGNSDVDVLSLPDDCLIVAQNCRLTPEGAVQKMRGTRRIHTTAIDGTNAIMGGFSWRKGDGTVQQLVTTDNLFTGTYALPTTWTSRAGALDGSKKHCFAAFRDGSGEVVYIADGGPLNKWDGAAVTTNIASTPNVTRIAAYNQRLFGISGTDQTLYWSALNNGDSLGVAGSGGGSAVVRTFGGQHLTALAPVGSSLLLFHANAISRFTGYAQTDINIDAGAVGHSAEIGTLAPRSVVVINHEQRDVAYFVTKRGLFMAGESTVVPIYTPFAGLLNSLGDSTVWAGVHCVHNPDQQELWVFVPAGGYYIYNYALKAWAGSNADGSNINVSWLGETDLGELTVLTGGVANDGFVRRFDYPDTTLIDINSDGTGGATVQTTLMLPPWTFGDESLEKTLRHLYVTARSSGATSVTINWGLVSTNELGAAGFTTVNGTETFALPMWGVGRYAVVSVDDQGSYPTVYSRFRAEAFALGRRR